MVIEQNFFKNIPIGYDIISKLLQFEKQILEAQYQIRELPRGYGICKVSNTNIFKFRLNSRDRILFSFIRNQTKTIDSIVFLKFVSHDNQIREGHSYDERSLNLVTIRQALQQKYDEDELDIQIEKMYTTHLDLSTIQGIVVRDEDLVRLAEENDIEFVKYLSDEQYDVLDALENQILLIGAGGTGKTVVLLHVLSMTRANSKSLYLTYTDLLLEKAHKDFQVFNKQEGLEFMTIRKLLCKLANIADTQMITTRELRRWLYQEKYKYSIVQRKEIHEIVAEIRGILTGYLGLEYKFVKSKIEGNQRLLSLDIYLDMPAHYSIFNKDEKQEIYKVAVAFQKWLDTSNKYSENDVARMILTANNFEKYDYVVIDEIQDLSELQIYLISKLVQPGGKIVWAGDINQTIYPTFFNFGRLKNLYYTYNKEITNKVLTKNFRGTKQITQLINNLVEERQKYIGTSAYDYEEVALKDGSEPQVLDFKPRDFVQLFKEVVDKHYCAIVVATEATKMKLVKLYPGIEHRIFLINEIKGLEYDNIYCYDLMSEYIVKWNEILNGKCKKNDQMKYYFNLLYVGVSRAKSNLFIYESKYDQLKFSPLKKCGKISAYNLELVALTTKSTAKDWADEAIRLAQSDQTKQSQLAKEYAKEAEIKEKIILEATSKTTEIEELRFMAEENDIESQYQLGLWYTAIGPTQDLEKSVEWFEKAANAGYALAQYQLGLCYKKGLGTKKNATKAFSYFLKAAEQGHALAQYHLAMCYIKSDGVEKDLKWHYGDGAKRDLQNALTWYQKAANQNVVEAQYQLGCCYKKGLGVETDIVKALEWFEKAAAMNYGEAQLVIGNCYAEGTGVPKSLLTAVEYWEKAAKQDSVEAMFILGECYDMGWYGIEKNLFRAVELWEAAAAKRFAPAQYRMALCYKEGRGVERDLKQSMKLYEKAASGGYVNAQYELAVMFEKKRDFRKAAKWYEKAANAAHGESMYRLAVFYDDGKGVKKDVKKAMELYKKAADLKNSAAQFMLSIRS